MKTLKANPNPSNASSLPVTLITGLLGSGKTTTLLNLLKQRPADEKWGVLVNEFGEIDIDGALIEAQQPETPLSKVSGGCICCTAQIGLVQGLNRLLADAPDLTRLFIEPTGLGHPAQIIDTLKTGQFARPLQLQQTLCILNPCHVTPERWQKSAVMRDLVTLADWIIFNHTDTCPEAQIEFASQHLQSLYPPKTQIIATQFGQLTTEQAEQVLSSISNAASFRLLSATPHLTGEHCETTISQECTLPGCLEQVVQPQPPHFAVGWRFNPQAQFNRVALKPFIESLWPQLVRAKGLIRTGKNWQLLQWQDRQLKLSDIAWRQDSRLELIFDAPPNLAELEAELAKCIRLKSL